MQGMVKETKQGGLTLERQLADLRGLERELNELGIDATLGEREGGMPRLTFDDLDGGLYCDMAGTFGFSIRSDDINGLYITRRFDEFRHELARFLAGRYERKAEDMPAEWDRLSGGGTPMPGNLAEKAQEYGQMADRLHNAIKDDDIPILLDGHDFRLLNQRDPRLHLPDPDAARLRDMGLVARRRVLVDVFDELTDEGRKAVEYTNGTMAWRHL